MTDLADENISQAHSGDTRRDFPLLTSGALGAVAGGLAASSFVSALNPAYGTLAVATTAGDLEPVAVGQRPPGAWGSPCHGSICDTPDRSGGIFQGPAPLNFALPSDDFTSNATVKIG
jgi:Ubiquitinol-cytochrome C reductase Fe-S subunit TAT signal